MLKVGRLQPPERNQNPKPKFAMTAKNLLSTITALLIAVPSLPHLARAADAGKSTEPAIDLFDAIDSNQVDAKFIAKNDHDARVLLKNTSGKPLSLKMPAAFAGVPLAQFGGGGGGRVGGGGGSRGSTSTGGGGGQQSVGGGGLGGGGGIGGGGGGGGFFSLPPEETAKLDVEVVCLDHGLRTPSGSAVYKLVPADTFLEDRPAVVELLKAFGRGDLKHGAVQAAAWNLNSGLTWDQLRTKLTGTRRSPSRAPYFTADEIRAGMAYASEATRLAEANAADYAAAKKARAEKAAKAAREASEAKSTTDDSNEPAPKTDDVKAKESAPTDVAPEATNSTEAQS